MPCSASVVPSDQHARGVPGHAHWAGEQGRGASAVPPACCASGGASQGAHVAIWGHCSDALVGLVSQVHCAVSGNVNVPASRAKLGCCAWPISKASSPARHCGHSASWRHDAQPPSASHAVIHVHIASGSAAGQARRGAQQGLPPQPIQVATHATASCCAHHAASQGNAPDPARHIPNVQQPPRWVQAGGGRASEGGAGGCAVQLASSATASQRGHCWPPRAVGQHLAHAPVCIGANVQRPSGRVGAQAKGGAHCSSCACAIAAGAGASASQGAAAPHQGCCGVCCCARGAGSWAGAGRGGGSAPRAEQAS